MLSRPCPALPRLLVTVVRPPRGVGGAVAGCSEPGSTWHRPRPIKTHDCHEIQAAGRPTQHHHQSRARTVLTTISNFLAIALHQPPFFLQMLGLNLKYFQKHYQSPNKNHIPLPRSPRVAPGGDCLCCYCWLMSPSILDNHLAILAMAQYRKSKSG